MKKIAGERISGLSRIFRKCTLITLAALILAAGCFSAAALGEGSILLPTPPPAAPTATPEPAQVIILDPSEPEILGDLPDPSYIIQSTGTEQTGYLTIGDSVYDARIYPVYNIGNAISEYLTACSEAGYKWEISDLFAGYLAYRIFGGGKSAYFIPDYGTTVLLLIEQGMTVQGMKPAPEAYEKNKLLLTVNGTVFQTDFTNALVWLVSSNSGAVRSVDTGTSLYIKGEQLAFYSENAPYQLVDIIIPKNARTSEVYTMSRKNRNPGIGFVLLKDFVSTGSQKDDVSGTIEPSMAVVLLGDSGYDIARVGLSSDSDYLNIQLIYINGSEFRGRVEGVFNDGKDQVSGTFWVVK